MTSDMPTSRGFGIVCPHCGKLALVESADLPNRALFEVERSMRQQAGWRRHLVHLEGCGQEILAIPQKLLFVRIQPDGSLAEEE
jgi:hypothetical protein